MKTLPELPDLFEIPAEGWSYCDECKDYFLDDEECDCEEQVRQL